MSSSQTKTALLGQEKPQVLFEAAGVAITVQNLSKCYQIYDQPHHRLLQMFVRNRKKYYREFWALRNINFEVQKGETVGIVGRNGSGKSTLLQLVCGTLNPTSGTIRTAGRIAALLELGSGFNPEFTGRENVYMNAAILGLSKEETDSRYDAIRDFADIGEFIHQPVKTYSSGMVVRLAFAVAINVNPQVLVIDESLSVGDAAFQRKCMRRLDELTDTGVTLLFVSHDIETVKKLCSSAIYLSQGSVRVQGSAKEVCMEYERELFGASNMDIQSSEPDVTEHHVNKTLLDPELLNANEKVYGDGKVIIEDIAITAQDLSKINVLSVGADFVVSYKVKFYDNVVGPIFGMMITTKEGICVFGTNTTGRPISSAHYQNGDVINISFSLTNNLGPGIYYLTCGVHSSDCADGVIYHQRRMDTLIIKSLGRDQETAAGMTHLLPVTHAVVLRGDKAEVA